MSFQDLSVIILISLLMVMLPSFGLAKLFVKAGIPSWKAYVPFYNTWEMLKVAGFRKHWFFYQFIPVVGWFITLWIFVEFVKLFGKFTFLQHAATVLIPFIYFPIIGNQPQLKFAGRDIVKKHKKTATREWIDAGVFAIVAATLIRTFVFEAYTIPTGSMEKTLLVNDFLFVSKLSYGPRIPNTPLAVPFVHHTLPITGTKSYSEIIKLPYRRWFASPVKRNDVVVFNFPAGDTLTERGGSQTTYYQMVRDNGRDAVWRDEKILIRPVDKRENYIKRCVAIAGDSIEIKEGILYVNNEKAFISPTSARVYIVRTNVPWTEDFLREAGVMLNDVNVNQGEAPDYSDVGGNTYGLNLTLGELEIVQKQPGFLSATPFIEPAKPGEIFPNEPSRYNWSVDNFGKLWVPKKGVRIELTPQNVLFYKRLIQVYENNEWEEVNGKIYLNGESAPATHYTFQMNYYWMMGDNRHRSQDSRYWGFVPEDHVVGEAWLIWMSWHKGIRWSRLFKTIH